MGVLYFTYIWPPMILTRLTRNIPRNYVREIVSTKLYAISYKYRHDIISVKSTIYDVQNTKICNVQIS